ncbi:MAG: efflux RND transporter permease subunit [Lysobacterales bacterium]
MNAPSPVEREQKGLIAWMVHNSIAAHLIMFLLLGGGAWTAITMQKEVDPEFALDTVDVRVAYPGAAPAEVEQGILLPVEEAARGVPGIKEIRSTAREGSGSVQFELVSGVDRIKAYQDIDQAVAQIRTFPDEVEKPDVSLRTRQREVMSLGLYGPVDVWALRQLAEQVRDQLLNQPEITQVELGNVPDYVTHVEIPLEQLREYGLTLGEVANIIEQSSRDVAAGSIDTSAGEILLRVNERKLWSEQLRDVVVVSGATGGPVLLRDIARVYDGFEEEGFHSQFNRQPSVELEVYRVGTQSPLEIVEAVDRVWSTLEDTLPPGVQMRIDNNSAEDFGDRLNLLLKNGALAVIIILVILSLFLEVRLSFWIMMGMAISFVGSFLVLPMADISINMISMFGFLVALGIVVDDAIVVGENTYAYRQLGMSRVEAAVVGAQEVARPVTFSILTNVVAFLPVLFLPGVTGNYWWALPAVVITVLLFSLAEALFILPAHLGHVGKRSRGAVADELHGWHTAVSRGFSHWIDTRYRPFLDLCLRHRYVTLTASLVVLVVTSGYALSDHMGMVLMPEMAADEIEAGVSLPVGTTRDQAAAVADRITEASYRMFEEHDLYRAAEGIKTNVRGGTFIDVEIVMRPPDERDMSTAEVIQLWRDQIGDIEGVDQITFEAERGPGGWRPDIAIDLSHADIEVLAQAGEAFLQRLESFEATRDVGDNYDPGKSQLNFTLLPEGRALGLTSAAVGRQVRDAFFGAVALRQLRGTNEIEVRVKLPESERKDMRFLDDFVLRTPDGVEVPLMSVVNVDRGEAFRSIVRRDGRRVITVSSKVEPKSAAGGVLQVVREELLPQLRAEYPGLTWTFEGSQAEMRDSTATLWGGFAMAMAAIYALLAVAFGSYTQPLIVMMAIPFGLVGAVLGHMLLGYDLSLVSMMGVVAVSGVVINGALIMVDHANRSRREQMSAYEAIHQAGLRRFRPIMLTTMTTFGGLTPIILESSRQAYHLVPMAISLGFGIVFATSIMLVVVPCLYMMLEDLRDKAQRDFEEETG